MELVTQIQILYEFFLYLVCANALAKGMNPYFLTSAIGK